MKICCVFTWQDEHGGPWKEATNSSTVAEQVRKTQSHRVTKDGECYAGERHTTITQV